MYSARPWSHRPTDAAFFVYFALHIVASLCMDFQGILPHWYPESLARLAAWYANTFGDFLMARVATDPSLRWFATFIWAELLVQLPVFFFACWQLWHDEVGDKTRTVLVAYGAHVTTTLLPIMHEFAVAPSLAPWQRVSLMALIYAPFLAMPILAVVYFGFYYPRHPNPVSEKIKKIKKIK